jgi:hypothetical protein
MDSKLLWILLGISVVGALGTLVFSLATSAHAEAPAAESQTPTSTEPAGEKVREKPAATPPADVPRSDNGVWMRRHWIHGGDDDLEVTALAGRLDALGIKRIYPFLGPMDTHGYPGWRKNGTIQRYNPERASRFFNDMDEHAPHVRVMPWTGGVLARDVRLTDRTQRRKFAKHTAKLADLGADGVHINIEPLPSGEPGYIDLLESVKEAMGPDKTLSIAAYPPKSSTHPFPDVHWSLEFTKEVCMAADELAFMGYDTGLRDPTAYVEMMATWTKDLLETLPSPERGGCEVLIGVPAYEDSRGYHRPRIENIATGLKGVKRGLGRLEKVPEHFRGVAIYASWVTDEKELRTYQRDWRGLDGRDSPVLPDFVRE